MKREGSVYFNQIRTQIKKKHICYILYQVNRLHWSGTGNLKLVRRQVLEDKISDIIDKEELNIILGFRSFMLMTHWYHLGRHVTFSGDFSDESLIVTGKWWAGWVIFKMDASLKGPPQDLDGDLAGQTLHLLCSLWSVKYFSTTLSLRCRVLKELQLLSLPNHLEAWGPYCHHKICSYNIFQIVSRFWV